MSEIGLRNSFLFILAALLFCPETQANVDGVPVLHGPCPPESVFTATVGGDMCWLKEAGMSPIFGENGSFQAGQGIGLVIELKKDHVPLNGRYKFRMHYCPTMGVSSWCKLSNSVGYMDSANSVLLYSNRNISAQNPNFGGNASSRGNLPRMTMCFTLVDDHGVEWGNKDSLICQDAHQLPVTPAVCYLNYDSDLDVSLGTLERSSIATQAKTTQAIRKAVSVLCTRDAGISVQMKFVYKPINIGGQQLVKTTTEGLGVAIIYKGKVMGPDDTITKNYSLGYSEFYLDFKRCATQIWNCLTLKLVALPPMRYW